MQFSLDLPWVLACGGQSGEIAVWDTSENKKIEEHFKPSLVRGTYDEASYNPDGNPEEVADDDDQYESMSEESEKKKKKAKKSKKSKH